MKTQGTSTLIGSLAIIQWSSLAVLTSFTLELPPLQLTAMGMTIGFGIGALNWVRRGIPLADVKTIPLSGWLVGIGGLFGYHLLYFLALRQAPLVQANLINYLWPLLTILMAGLLPGEALRWRHGIGGMLGFSGAALIIVGGKGLAFSGAHLTGYALALGCATVWAGYSVLTRRSGSQPTRNVTAYCGATALLSWLVHFLTEETVAPTGGQWVVVLILGVGPLGLAFYVWDHGVKKGSIQTLGTLSYFAPLLSTLLLIAFGQAQPSTGLALACLLIIGGAVVATGATRPTRSS